MGESSDSPGTLERPRLVPRPGWLCLVAFVLILVAVGLNVSVPVYRERAALRVLRPFVYGDLQTRQTGPRWLRRWAGESRMNVLDKVEGITLRGPLVDDDILLNLHNLSHLQKVCLVNTSVTDVGLQRLVSLQGLTDVVPVRNPAITAEGVAKLRSARPKLRVHY
jgi:hypothetical protein